MPWKRYIAITSIFHPTEGIVKFSSFEGWQTIVVGDKKTPVDWECENAIFISTNDQVKLDYNVVQKLPYNHYSRKMIAYIYAIKQGAEVIADTDDDNVPKQNWVILPRNGNYLTTKKDLGFINIYKAFTDQHIWPRGFPLTRIKDGSSGISHSDLYTEKVRAGIWQGLVDGDPDVDAIYRLTNNQPCYFDEKGPIVLNKGTICPFNSQNTIFCFKDLFPLLYLPAFVNFRFTDILRGLIAQPIMWAHGYYLGFTSPTAVQKRNPHNYLEDFYSEIPCFLYPERMIEIVSSVVRTRASISDNLHFVYEALEKEKITTREETDLLCQWLKDVT